MVSFKRKVSIFLIVAFSLSLIPYLDYNQDKEASAAHSLEGDATCQWGGGLVTVHQSCFADLSEEEFACGVEIPIGEVIDRTIILTTKIRGEFYELIANAKNEITTTEKILSGNCQTLCQTGCSKYKEVRGKLISGPTECSVFPGTPNQKIVACALQSCLWCGNCIEPCDQCQCADETYSWHCWEETQGTPPVTCYYCQEGYPYAGKITGSRTPESPGGCSYYSEKNLGDLSLCQYQGIEDSAECEAQYGSGTVCCEEKCFPWGCLGPAEKQTVLDTYNTIKDIKDSLKKSTDEEDQPDKFKRGNILNQLKFSRCELSKCGISAEDYPKVMTGEKSGKWLYTCERVQEMGLLEDDQIECMIAQALFELENAADKSWWDWVKLIVKIVWQMFLEWIKGTEEEGCFPTNYYCCQM